MPAEASPEPTRSEVQEPSASEWSDDKARIDLVETEELRECARRELGETEDIKTRTLQELKDLIYERGEVTPYRMDDPFLLRFLRARSFNVDRAHRLLRRYTRFKDENPGFHKGVDPEGFTALGEADVMTVMPCADQHGRRILIYRLGNWEPSKVPLDDLFRASIILLELGIMEPRTQIKGGVVIFDLQGIGLQHAWQMSPAVAVKVIQLLETASPVRTQAVHILNGSWVFDIIYGLFSPILGDQHDKLFFHGSDLTSLHEHIDPKHLSVRYGGTRQEVPYTEWLDTVRSMNPCLKELKNLGYKIKEDDSLNQEE